MVSARIKLDRDLLARMRELAEERGYSSVEEYIHRVLELEVERAAAPLDDAVLRERLRGLGYVE